jgi:hypothetical protein
MAWGFPQIQTHECALSFLVIQMPNRVRILITVIVLTSKLIRNSDQANQTYKSLLASELFPDPEPSIPPSNTTGTPPQTPTKRRIFNYSSPGASGSRPRSMNRPGLDSPSHEAYSTSPLRNLSQRLLTSPQRPVRVVGKTPYKVLDAPELAVRHLLAGLYSVFGNLNAWLI